MTFEKAIVLGTGIAGLATARVLAQYFRAVTVIDRDDVPPTPQVRAGAAQGFHIHTLLPGGLDILSDLFPDLENDLDANGGHSAGPTQWYALTAFGKTYRLSRFQPTPIEDGAPRMRAQTRPLLEHCIRAQVAALPNVTTLYKTAVNRPLVENGCIVGIALSSGESLQADLVVDATGRESQTLRWLDELGLSRPDETTVNCDFAYGTALFRPNDDVTFDDVGFLISSARKGEYVKRGGSLTKVEGGDWLVTLAGRLGDYPPKDIAGFKAFIDTLHNPRLADLLKQAELLVAPKQYLFPKSVRRHFENLAAFPDGLLPIGDALCHINPGYAQGMSLACRQVAELDKVLAARHDRSQPIAGLWRDFFPRAHEQTRAPWVFAALTDFSKKGTTGDFPEEEADKIAELKRLNKLADEGDRDAAQLVDSVFDMQAPLSAL